MSVNTAFINFLCGRPDGRITGHVRPSVCFSSLSVCPIQALNAKTGKRKKNFNSVVY